MVTSSRAARGHREPTRLTLRDVRRSLAPDAVDPLAVRWFGRPLGNVATPLAWRLGLTADAVTYLHLVVTIGGLVAVAVPGRATASAAALAFYVGFVLDCVDGNIARLENAATYYGKFIDGLVDASFVLLVPVFAGLALLVADGDVVAFGLGASITILGLAAQYVQARASFLRELMHRMSPETMRAAEPTTGAGRARIERASGSLLVNGTFLAPICLFLPGGRWWYLLVLVVVQPPADLATITSSVLRARATLKVWRRSRHAA